MPLSSKISNILSSVLLEEIFEAMDAASQCSFLFELAARSSDPQCHPRMGKSDCEVENKALFTITALTVSLAWTCRMYCTVWKVVVPDIKKLELPDDLDDSVVVPGVKAAIEALGEELKDAESKVVSLTRDPACGLTEQQWLYNKKWENNKPPKRHVMHRVLASDKHNARFAEVLATFAENERNPSLLLLFQRYGWNIQDKKFTFCVPGIKKNLEPEEAVKSLHGTLTQFLEDKKVNYFFPFHQPPGRGNLDTCSERCCDNCCDCCYGTDCGLSLYIPARSVDHECHQNCECCEACWYSLWYFCCQFCVSSLPVPRRISTFLFSYLTVGMWLGGSIWASAASPSVNMTVWSILCTFLVFPVSWCWLYSPKGRLSGVQRQALFLEMPVISMVIAYYMMRPFSDELLEMRSRTKWYARLFADLPDTIIGITDAVIFGASPFNMLLLFKAFLEIFYWFVWPIIQGVAGAGKGIAEGIANAAKDIARDSSSGPSPSRVGRV
eukprot:gnl/MRDRNA2_/MRDRNA2_167026_c0_seq1.p1 gnl/MRDRNA2_/MRDRNA2_167026_c0~~gnl/MRDRNA2_/MRDRNA2_167026_c0_seq1.p1  ORF type:complete len:497 (+),score=48.53 gnl/MRDRNA2_/MRDRNA2_167026_c0_seq1:117-1607(+)